MITAAQWHDQLTPQFDLSLDPLNPGPDDENQVGLLTVTLTGPTSLIELDDLTITVLDDRERPVLGMPGGPSRQDVRNQIWGPYRWTPGTNGADEHGRTARPLSMQREAGTLPCGESLRLQMDPTPAPHWYAPSPEAWRSHFPLADPVRLRIEASRGKERWIIALETTFNSTQRPMVGWM